MRFGRLACFGSVVIASLVSGCGGESGFGEDGGAPPFWPLHGRDAPDAAFSATYGPRLQAGGDYEFHRGLDIPTPVGTDVHAITNGRVYNILTDDIATQGQRVELCHAAKDGDAPPEDCAGAAFFGFYSHLSTLDVKLGDVVSVGGKLGQSGVGPNGFAHLHFEVRNDNGHAEDALHPLTVLPYPDAGPPEIAITKVDSADPTHPIVTVTAKTKAAELDLTSVSVKILGAGGTAIDARDFVSADWNRKRTESGGDAEVNTPEIDGIRLTPEPYSQGTAEYVLHVTFLSLKGPASAADLRVEATATDARGNEAIATSP